MSDTSEKLWPYRKALALLFIPLTWLCFTIWVNYAGWVNPLEGALVIIVGITSIVPVIFILFDFLSEKGASFGYKDLFKIDFSLSKIKRESFGLPDNIGKSGPIFSDTSPMDILETLKISEEHEIIVLNLKNGKAWWVTRLLALSAGAMRQGSPSVIVFIGRKENADNYFLGWGRPKDILKAILEDKTDYRIRYENAIQIARQVMLYNSNKFLPIVPNIPPVNNNIILHDDIKRYVNDPRYANQGEEITEQIIMDQLANVFSYQPVGSLETIPDEINIGRLNHLFDSCLYRDSIDLDEDGEVQVRKLLNAQTPYMALVRNNQYDSVVKQSDGEKLVLRKLLQQGQKKKKKEE